MVAGTHVLCTHVCRMAAAVCSLALTVVVGEADEMHVIQPHRVKEEFYNLNLYSKIIINSSNNRSKIIIKIGDTCY